MACKPLISKSQRETAVRPPNNDKPDVIAPIAHEPGDLEGDNETAEAQDAWKRLANKYEDLEAKVHEYLEDETNADARDPPIVKFPPNMTKEEWDKHQVIHTPFAPGCKHCAAARPIRRRHPKKRKHNVLVPDIDGSKEGPTKISMDYMYLSERNKGDTETANNPPHLVVIDHRHGRIWAHRIPHKGVFGKAKWVPRRMIQDLSNNGMQNVTIQVKTNQEPSIVNVQIAMQ